MTNIIPVPTRELYKHVGEIRCDNRGEVPTMSLLIDHLVAGSDEMDRRKAERIAVPFDPSDPDVAAVYAGLKALSLRALNGEFDA